MRSGVALSSGSRLHSTSLNSFTVIQQGRIVIDLYNQTTNQLLGSITEADLQVLVDALEEESADDKDYYITAATIEVIADGRASDHLVGLLRKALGNGEGVDIRWSRR
jgi:hypothetical protein